MSYEMNLKAATVRLTDAYGAYIDSMREYNLGLDNSDSEIRAAAARATEAYGSYLEANAVYNILLNSAGEKS